MHADRRTETRKLITRTRTTTTTTTTTTTIIIIIIIIMNQELANEICAKWKQNAVQAIPIVISSTGVIPKSLSQSLKRLDLHTNTYVYIQMQKSVILVTCSIVRNFQNYK